MEKKKLKKLLSVSLSGGDIISMLGGKTKILTYPTLHKIKDINEILEPYGNCIILYMTSGNYGHWTCLINHNDRIEFYDPYKDYLPDDELKDINKEFRIESKQDKPYLTRLLYNSKKDIEYNNYSFQKWDPDIRTCGRHCIARILFKNFKLDEYYDIIKMLSKESGLTIDELITYITENINYLR